MYREYDCLDPLARAPTPLPPVFLDDEDEVQIDVATTEPEQHLDSGSTATSTESVVVQPDTPCPRPDHIVTSAEVPRTPGSIRRFAINFLTKPNANKTTPEREADVSPEDSDSIASRLKAAVVVSGQADTVEVMHRSYEPCERPNLAKRENSSVKMPDTPPDSPVQTVSILQNTSPASTISTLSSVPSNLSDQDKDEGINVSSFNRSEASTTDFRRSKVPPPHKAVQVCPTPHPRFHHQRGKAQRRAVSPRRSRRALKGSL